MQPRRRPCLCLHTRVQSSTRMLGYAPALLLGTGRTKIWGEPRPGVQPDLGCKGSAAAPRRRAAPHIPLPRSRCHGYGHASLGEMHLPLQPPSCGGGEGPAAPGHRQPGPRRQPPPDTSPLKPAAGPSKDLYREREPSLGSGGCTGVLLPHHKGMPRLCRGLGSPIIAAAGWGREQPPGAHHQGLWAVLAPGFLPSPAHGAGGPGDTFGFALRHRGTLFRAVKQSRPAGDKGRRGFLMESCRQSQHGCDSHPELRSWIPPCNPAWWGLSSCPIPPAWDFGERVFLDLPQDLPAPAGGGHSDEKINAIDTYRFLTKL